MKTALTLALGLLLSISAYADCGPCGGEKAAQDKTAKCCSEIADTCCADDKQACADKKQCDADMAGEASSKTDGCCPVSGTKS